jgi:hypothetical protein
MKQTAKEKAEELVHKFDLMQTCIEGFSLQDAKECALIGVDEILIIMNEEYFSDALKIDYWEEVKQEIIKFKNK